MPTIRSTRRRGGATGRAFGDDYLTFNTHTSTHVDSLAHVWWDGLLYNGHDAEVHVTSWDGATRNGIETMGGFATRGVLLDVAGHRGVPHLPHGHRISARELEATAEAQGVTVRSGDALLVRTGWIRVWSEDRERFLATRRVSARTACSSTCTVIRSRPSGRTTSPWRPGIPAWSSRSTHR